LHPIGNTLPILLGIAGIAMGSIMVVIDFKRPLGMSLMLLGILAPVTAI
jgi:hypothetical protein